MKTEKISLNARRLDKFCKVLQKIIQITIIVLVCIIGIMTIVNVIDPNATIGEDLNVISIGDISLELAEDHTPSNNSLLVYEWMLLAVAVICASIICVSIKYVRKILAPMAEGRPFHANTAYYLKKLAYVFLVLGIAQNIGAILANVFALHFFGLNNGLESSVINSITVEFKPDLGFILTFFVLLLMSYIFSYGAKLQQESDETL